MPTEPSTEARALTIAKFDKALHEAAPFLAAAFDNGDPPVSFCAAW
jgi:hypothetical protein